MILVLIGYMASGKSQIGKKLAKTLKYNFVDLDNYIELQEENSVKNIFSKKGELYFRKIEKDNLDEIISTYKNTIISLGGGTPCYYDTIDTLIDNKNIKTIYLKVSLPELVNRLLEDKENRPLLSNINNEELMTEFVGKHLFERSQYYEKTEFIIDANSSINVSVEKIIMKLF